MNPGFSDDTGLNNIVPSFYEVRKFIEEARGHSTGFNIGEEIDENSVERLSIRVSRPVKESLSED